MTLAFKDIEKKVDYGGVNAKSALKAKMVNRKLLSLQVVYLST